MELPVWIQRMLKRDDLTKVQKYRVDYYRARYQATPPWNDLKERGAVNALYREAARRRQLGEDVVVDHVLPLKSDVVCGLHVSWNLMIITHDENAAKAATYWPGKQDLIGKPELRFVSDYSGRWVQIEPMAIRDLPKRIQYFREGDDLDTRRKVLVVGYSRDKQTMYFQCSDKPGVPKYSIKAVQVKDLQLVATRYEQFMQRKGGG